EDAKIGHKTKDTSFFGYKTHIAMSEERIITAATVTTGEKNDGKELETLIEKSKEAGMEVNTVIIDEAYSETGNIENTNKNEKKISIKKSKVAGMEINTVIGDAAYSEKGNIEYTNKNEVELVAKLNPITQGTRTKEDEFEFNKDAGMYVCKAGHMAIRKAR